MEIPRIGKGKNFSIAKAALILYFESDKHFMYSIDYGELDACHDIIDIAGAKHCSFFTSPQVISCLRSSPYWNCVGIKGFYRGIGNGKASSCNPSKKGINYYESHLKNRKKD